MYASPVGKYIRFCYCGEPEWAPHERLSYVEFFLYVTSTVLYAKPLSDWMCWSCHSTQTWTQTVASSDPSSWPRFNTIGRKICSQDSKADETLVQEREMCVTNPTIQCTNGMQLNCSTKLAGSSGIQIWFSGVAAHIFKPAVWLVLPWSWRSSMKSWQFSHNNNMLIPGLGPMLTTFNPLDSTH